MKRSVSAKLLVLVGFFAAACGGATPETSEAETSSLAGGCPATEVPQSVVSGEGGIRGELKRSREWKMAQGRETVRDTKDQALVSATVSVAGMRPTKSMGSLMSDNARDRLVRVHAGVPTSNGFYTFPLNVAPDSDRKELLATLQDDLDSQISSLKTHLMDVAGAPESDPGTKEIAQRVSEELTAGVDAMERHGVPLYALEFSNLGGKEAKRITAGKSTGAVVALVPQGCDLAEPAYPGEAVKAWGEAEDQATAEPVGPPPAEAPAP